MNSISTKPGQVKSVYLGGRIAHTDWRHDIAENLRGAVINADPQLDEPLRTELLPTMRVQGGPTHISGPYFISCDHGGFHGPGSHGVGADYSESRCCPFEMMYPNPRTYAVQRCMTWLRDADVMFVWAGPDFHHAHGTHAEMGVAHALGKPIFAAVASGALTDSMNEEQVETWFAMELARSFPAPDPVSGFAAFVRMVAEKR